MKRARALAGLAAIIALGAGPAATAQVAAPVADSGHTAWILAATALVLFMTLPGLALFYAGLVRSKNALSVMMHCVAIACLGSVLWLFGGYSLAFSGSNPIIGDLAKFGLPDVRGAVTGALPESVFFAFQMTFAIITPALIVGVHAGEENLAGAERDGVSRPLDGVELCGIASAVGVHAPRLAVGLALRVDGEDDALRTEAIRGVSDELRVFDRGRVERNLVRAAFQHRFNICQRAQPATDLII